jgi:hypothetical protein
MIRLRQLLESSARDRLKGRVKDSNKDELQVDKKYLDRIKAFEKTNLPKLKSAYELLRKGIPSSPGVPDYYPILHFFFRLSSDPSDPGKSYIAWPYPDMEQREARAARKFKKILQNFNFEIPETYDRHIVAFFLQFIEEDSIYKIKVL